VRLRLFVLAALFACVGLVAAGCGGGGKKQIASAAGVCFPASTPPSAYQVTGKIIADSGFRPDTDGFGVENYGNCGQQNLTPKAMSDLFGAQQVCLSGSGADCQLDPAASKWMETTNQQMEGGHCMGFSVTALRFFSGNLSPSDFGADSTFGLDVKSDADLQSVIAAGWVYQFLPRVTNNELAGTPNQLLGSLVQSLKSDKSNRGNAYPNSGPLYTIKIFNNEGGHAVTPYAVEDKGDGKYAVLIYDNNYPGIPRAIQFDSNANTWSYNAATKPGEPSALYTGDANSVGTMRLDPTGPGEFSPQQFDFTNSPNVSSAGSAGSAGSTTLYNQISLLGDPSNHGHLLIRDKDGRETGFVNGRIVNQIPGVKVEQIASLDNWASTPEPNYLIPASEKAITVFVDGSDLTKADKETLTLIGQGFYTEVSDLKLRPGQRDGIYFTGDGKGFVYRTAPGQDQSPTVASAIVKGNDAIAFAAKAVGVKGGSQLTMYIDQNLDAFVLDTTGTTPVKAQHGLAAYVISAVREGPQSSTTWVTKKPLLLKPKSQAIIGYGHLPAANKNVPVYTGRSPLKIEKAKVQYLQPQ
jgi:hypothetical protein